jgi:hypothetical protein
MRGSPWLCYFKARFCVGSARGFSRCPDACNPEQRWAKLRARYLGPSSFRGALYHGGRNGVGSLFYDLLGRPRCWTVVGRGIQRRSMWGAGLPCRQQRNDGGMADLLPKPLRCGQEKIPRPRSFAFRRFLDKVLIQRLPSYQIDNCFLSCNVRRGWRMTRKI